VALCFPRNARDSKKYVQLFWWSNYHSALVKNLRQQYPAECISSNDGTNADRGRRDANYFVTSMLDSDLLSQKWAKLWKWPPLAIRYHISSLSKQTRSWQTCLQKTTFITHNVYYGSVMNVVYMNRSLFWKDTTISPGACGNLELTHNRECFCI